jgi:hypothetical protein
MFVIATGLPLLLELGGVLSETVAVEPDHISVTAPLLPLYTPTFELITIGSIVFLLVTAARIQHITVNKYRAAQRQLQIQAWQLRQMVPGVAG